MMGILPSAWETERLIVTDSRLEEVARLRDVFNACAYVGQWDPTFYVVGTEEITELVAMSLAAEGKTMPHFRMQSVHLKAAEGLIGYFHLTQGEPEADLIWLSMFVIHPDYQARQYGAEVIAGLKHRLSRLNGYRAVRLEIYLKNWPALRFWLGQGFSKIVGYEGDKIHAAETQASLVLEWVL
jgi:ribosomal protein S18 acetylase RimI-like enzyme